MYKTVRKAQLYTRNINTFIYKTTRLLPISIRKHRYQKESGSNLNVGGTVITKSITKNFTLVKNKP